VGLELKEVLIERENETEEEITEEDPNDWLLQADDSLLFLIGQAVALNNEMRYEELFYSANQQQQSNWWCERCGKDKKTFLHRLPHLYEKFYDDENALLWMVSGFAAGRLNVALQQHDAPAIKNIMAAGGVHLLPGLLGNITEAERNMLGRYIEADAIPAIVRYIQGMDDDYQGEWDNILLHVIAKKQHSYVSASLDAFVKAVKRSCNRYLKTLAREIGYATKSAVTKNRFLINPHPGSAGADNNLDVNPLLARQLAGLSGG
jgi:hypothetical protein